MRTCRPQLLDAESRLPAALDQLSTLLRPKIDLGHAKPPGIIGDQSICRPIMTRGHYTAFAVAPGHG